MKEIEKKDPQVLPNNPSKLVKEDENLFANISTKESIKSIANRNAVLSIIKAMDEEDLKITASVIPSEILVAELYVRLIASERKISNISEYLKGGNHE